VRGIRLSDRLLIAGQTGKGKTTFAEYIVGALQPVRTIIFDPKGELELGEADPCRTPDQLAHCIREPVVHYIPASFDREQLEDACQIVKNTPGPYVWWIDEAAELTTPNYCPAGLRIAVTQGRRHRKMVIALTQRLAEIHPVFRSQSEHVIIFTPAPIELDLKTIAGNVRREWRVLDAELGSLHAEHGDFSHLWYVRDTDELRRCAPLPLGEHPGAPGGTQEPADAPGGTPGADKDGDEESASCEESDSGSGRSSRSP
jgi:energy-coupling factor transporter ATP-binding protein EcfA2